MLLNALTSPRARRCATGLLALACTAPPPPARSVAQDSVGSEARLRLHEIKSRVFDTTRTLRVLVPAGYDDPSNRARRYPVLYLNDGQSLFDSTLAYFNHIEWRVDETVDSLVGRGAIPPLIVVGIDNGGRRRRPHEYLPYPDVSLQPPEPDPQGKRYPEFLIGEVMPFVGAHYRVLETPQHTGLGGSSYGGLVAVYTAAVRPGVFGRLLIESPSLYVDDGAVFRDAARQREWPARIYLGVGTNESGRPNCRPDAPYTPGIVTDVKRLKTLLRDAGVDSTRLRVVIEPCGVHDESAWARRLPAALVHLFGSRASPT